MERIGNGFFVVAKEVGKLAVRSRQDARPSFERSRPRF
jgi:methyl-accepting chemotaxis protein